MPEVQDKPGKEGREQDKGGVCGPWEPEAAAPAHRLSAGGGLCRERAVEVDAPGRFLDGKMMTCKHLCCSRVCLFPIAAVTDTTNSWLKTTALYSFSVLEARVRNEP